MKCPKYQINNFICFFSESNLAKKNSHAREKYICISHIEFQQDFCFNIVLKPCMWKKEHVIFVR